jgi:hypothetical protein
MYSSKLSPPLNIDSFSNSNDIHNYLHSYFKANLMDQTIRPKLFGKFIYIDCSKWIDYKNQEYWHLASLNQTESFNILPCNNCLSAIKCNQNCVSPYEVIQLSNGVKRNVCFYRGIRINWINEIINLTNLNDPNIKKWNKNVQIRGTNRVQLFIRFQHEAVDYVLLFEEKYKGNALQHYHFVAAYPVFYINTKAQYDDEYQAHTAIIANTP